jgi:hypothetical protein
MKYVWDVMVQIWFVWPRIYDDSLSISRLKVITAIYILELGEHKLSHSHIFWLKGELPVEIYWNNENINYHIATFLKLKGALPVEKVHISYISRNILHHRKNLLIVLESFLIERYLNRNKIKHIRTFRKCSIRTGVFYFYLFIASTTYT